MQSFSNPLPKGVEKKWKIGSVAHKPERLHRQHGIIGGVPLCFQNLTSTEQETNLMSLSFAFFQSIFPDNVARSF